MSTMERDVAVVLSGGAVNGVLMELGFLQRLRASELWPRVGWIYGTSSGALSGTMAALDRLDELQRFMELLQPEETFRPHSLWRLPLLGSHDYRLPATVRERLGDPLDMAHELRGGPIELRVCATDVTGDRNGAGPHAFELVYSSHHDPPERMAEAVLASAAVSGLVLPVRVGDRIATDGAWVRNFPLGLAYDEPSVGLIVAFRYEPMYPEPSSEWLTRLRGRLQRFGRVPPVAALATELEEAEQRAARGEPAHWGDMLVRLMRVAVLQNTLVEERFADEKDQSIRELGELRRDVIELVRSGAGRRGERLAREIDERFAAARFPFRRDRLLPRITVRGTAGDDSLETGLRTAEPWTIAAKHSLIRRGRELLDAELAAAGLS
jgi:predicted acylesterase/phospholipase RssA